MTEEHQALVERGSGAVVVAVSGSESDLLTLPQAVRGAVREQARLLVVHVVGALGRDADGEVDEAILERFAEVGEAVLARAVDHVRELAPELPVDDALLSGDRVGVVAALTSRARRVYVGTSETSSVRPLVPGQMVGGITGSARCPVLIVRGERTERGGRVLAYLDDAAEADVVAFAEREARLLGLPLTIVHRGTLGDPWPVAPDVAVTRLLVPGQAQAQQLLGSRRNDLLVFSATDLRAERASQGARTLRNRYAGTACLVAIIPEGYASEE